MTSDQIKKLAAAGLTVEQIAVVAEVMEAPRKATPEEVMYHIHSAKPPPHYPPGCRGSLGGGQFSWGYDVSLKQEPADKIETKVQHGELTVWPEKPMNEWTAKQRADYVKAYNEENRSR